MARATDIGSTTRLPIRNQENPMMTFKTIGRGAAVFSLTLLAASFAHAQDSTGSTDIYRNEFTKSFGLDHPFKAQSQAPIASASTDIWSTNFQKVYGTDKSVPVTPELAGETGSTDIWNTNFQKAFM
jgi:hypothetical protein